MYLNNLKLTNFKSYTQADVDFSANLNCLVGDNGVGKTNLLDAIYYLSFCKSYFNPIDSQNIKNGEDYFAIHGRYSGLDSQPVQVSCVQRSGQSKQMKYDQKTYSALAEHIGRIPLVIVSPTDQILITGGSDVRRKFLNGVISQTDKEYLYNLLQYEKALAQRNRLLKQFYDQRQWDAQAISVWDEQLSRFGTPLFVTRKQFLQRFIPIFDHYYKWISGDLESLSVEYDTQYQEDRSFASLLDEAHKADSRALYTTVGPHKDDLSFQINHMPVKKFASQGQQKTLALALKLAQFQYILDNNGVKPILLLDDIFDKLDLARIKHLIRLVASDSFGQVFLSDTQPGRVQQILAELPNLDHMIYNISRDGLISQQ